jgi:hypothetical protein
LPLQESGRAAAKAFSSTVSLLGRAVKVIEQECFLLHFMTAVMARADEFVPCNKSLENKRLLKLIRGFLTAGLLENALASPSVEGTPQGGPLSAR